MKPPTSITIEESLDRVIVRFPSGARAGSKGATRSLIAGLVSWAALACGWIVVSTVGAVILGATAETWFAMLYLALVSWPLAFVFMLVAHRWLVPRQVIEITPQRLRIRVSGIHRDVLYEDVKTLRVVEGEGDRRLVLQMRDGEEELLHGMTERELTWTRDTLADAIATHHVSLAEEGHDLSTAAQAPEALEELMERDGEAL